MDTSHAGSDLFRSIPTRVCDACYVWREVRGPTVHTTARVRNFEFSNEQARIANLWTVRNFETKTEDQLPIDIIDIIDHEQVYRFIHH
jgi:hypothetical protein